MQGCSLSMCTKQQDSTEDLTKYAVATNMLHQGNGATGSMSPGSVKATEDRSSVDTTGRDRSVVKRWTRLIKAGTEVYCSRCYQSLPNKLMSPLAMDVFACYSGPDQGLAIVPDLEKFHSRPHYHNSLLPATKDIAGAQCWNKKSRKAYGISLSLYDQHPVNGKISGDPIADSFAVCARKNSGILAVADGVNWGEKSKIAARCAIYGAVNYINAQLYGRNSLIKQTNEVFYLLRNSLDLAHQCILTHAGGLTTLCVAAVLPIKHSRQFAVCTVNVGDSLAYVFSRHHGLREITTGSHDISEVRDIRDAGGALGPVNGCEPELNNLMCSLTFADPGDIVYLTTDGISDNFDPVITKVAIATDKKAHLVAGVEGNGAMRSICDNISYCGNEITDTSHITSDNQDANSNASMDIVPLNGNCARPPAVKGREDTNPHSRLEWPAFGLDQCATMREMGSKDGKPEMFPHERHQYAVKQMERVIHEFELNTESAISSQELCGALVQHVLSLTDPKRKVLENPELYGKKLRSKERKKRDSQIVAQMSQAAGKLDHATIVSYEVGCYHGNDDECYESDDEQRGDDVRDANLRHMDEIMEHDTISPNPMNDFFISSKRSSISSAEHSKSVQRLMAAQSSVSCKGAESSHSTLNKTGNTLAECASLIKAKAESNKAMNESVKSTAAKDISVEQVASRESNDENVLLMQTKVNI